MRKLDNKSCEGLCFASKDSFTPKLEKPTGKTSDFVSVVYKASGMKFCAQVPRTCVRKHLVLDFHLFA